MQETFVLERVIDDIRAKIRPQWRWAFISCFVVGILTFGYFMTHHFLTADSLWNLVSDQDMITSGRQFLTYACSISTDYDLPWINGLLAIFYMSVTSVFVVEGLGIKSKYLSALSGAVLISFPSIISTFCYSYTIDGYMLAVLLATIAFFITDRKKWGFALGIIMLGFSLGIYQAYFSFTIVLCILKLLLDVLEGIKLKTIFSKIWRYMIMGIGSFVFYYISLQVMLKIQNTSLSDYQGVSNLEQFSFSDIPNGIVGAYKTFFSFLRAPGALATTTVMYVMVIALVAFGVLLYLWKFISEKYENKIIRLFIIIGLLAVTPVGATIVYVMAPTMYFHLLMRLPWVLFFVFVLALIERMPGVTKEIWKKMQKIFATAVCLATVMMVLQFSITANVVAFNMEEKYEKTYGLSLRILDRLEQTEGYKTGDKIAFVGGGVDPAIYPYTDLTSPYLKGYFGVEGTLCAYDTSKFATFWFHYLNVTINPATWDETLGVIETEEYKEMENFPNESSIRKIGEIWVVKLNG